MQAASNRTFICSVVFLDIVGYSKKPVAEQIQLKERLNSLLTEALANVAPNDRIILDTGDGAALSFIGDPEDALFVSLTLRDALANPGPNNLSLPLRLGINLGPVKLVKDINGQPNIIGDGINVAQRVMSFSQPGQILVSRSYYEVVSCLSEDYVKLFHYEGARTDKHVREHEVYAVESSNQALAKVAASSNSRRKTAAESGAIDKLSESASVVTDNVRRRPLLTTAATVVAILSIAIAIRANRPPAPAPVASPTPPAKVAAAPSPAAKEKEAMKENAKAAEKPAAKPKESEKDKTAQAKKASATPPVASAKASPPPPASAPAPAPAAQAAIEAPKPAAVIGSGMLRFTVQPWGEIYVDGKREGEIPPTYELRVSAGRHRVELRNPDFAPHVQTVDVAAGGRVDIRHVFLPKEQPNPLRNIWK